MNIIQRLTLIGVLAALAAAGCASGRVEQAGPTAVEAPTRTASAAPRPEATATREPKPTVTPTPRACLEENDLAGSLDLMDPIDEAVAAYLNAGGSAEQVEDILAKLCEEVWGTTGHPLLFELTEFDVDGDGQDDLLFTAARSVVGDHGDTYAAAYLRNGDGVEHHILYRRAGAGSGGEGLYSGGGARIVDAGDFNNNGRAEVALHVRWPTYGRVFVLEWTGESFASLIRRRSEITFEDVFYLDLAAEEVEVVDEDGDGREDLVLVSALQGGGEPITEPLRRREVWTWNGELYEQQGASYRPDPTYRIEALYLGELAWSADDMDQALAFYQQAVFDEALLGWASGFEPDGGPPAEPDPAERERINAFGRLRILMIHAHRGADREAEIVYESLSERVDPDSAGGPTRGLANAFWVAYTRADGGFWPACQRAGEYAQEHAAEVLEPLGRGYYGRYGRAFEAEHLCPPATFE